MVATKRDEIEASVCDIVSSTFGIQRAAISFQSAMADVPGWDSLGHMNLVAELESHFGVRFPVYAISELTSVDAIVREIQGLRP